MALEPVDEQELEELFTSPDEVLLKLLQKKRRPVLEEELNSELELATGFSISSKLFESMINGLIAEGYDIKTIYYGDKKQLSLVRNPEVIAEDYYRILGDIETPFIISGDHHMGSKTFTEMGFKELLKDVEEYSVKDVLMPGDILQGRGVHHLEANDVSLWNISDQMDLATENFNRFPKGTKLHVVTGNHENKIKGSVQVGLEVFKHMAPRVDNMKYYGSVAKLGLNDDFSVLMLHTSGGPSYARSYPAQKLWRELIERPNILATGHLHWIYAIPNPRFNLWTMGGTLQRENAYLINKGIISQVGWLIINKFGNGSMDVIYRIPETY